MKGTVYSGIVFLPDHPGADLHGMVRLACKETNRMRLVERLERLGIPTTGVWTSKTWQESKSHTEQAACERYPGELLVCPIARQYLDPAEYHPIPRAFYRRRPTVADLRPRTGIVPKEILR